MSLKDQHKKPLFGLEDLGLLEGPALRGTKTVVQMTAVILRADSVSFLVFDDKSSCVYVRARSRDSKPVFFVEMSASLCSVVRSETRPVAINSTVEEAPDAPERFVLDAGAFLGAPVYGPSKEPIGVLAACHKTVRAWTSIECETLEDMAYLISQEIMLRASFETIRIMKRDRDRKKI